MKRSIFILAAAVIISFSLGAACGYMAGTGQGPMAGLFGRASGASESGSGPEKPDPAVPALRGVFSWHAFQPGYRDALKTYHIDQVYQCYDEALAKKDYDAIRDNLKLLEGYDVWLLTGDPNWGAEEMLKEVELAKKVGGFRGVVFDVEPKEFDQNYIRSVEKVCESSDMDVMFCLPYWVEDEVVAQVMAAADGVMAMNYDKGHEYANIASWINMAGKEDVPLITIYELQPPNDEYGLNENGTYDGDAAACEENFARQFAGIHGLGMAFHYIKYL